MGYLFAVYSVFIVLGSVHLGWHYAIDSYASLITTPLLWMFSGFVVRAVDQPRRKV
jgi:hypothetical protein